MRHQVPDGDVGKILGKAIAVLLAQVRKQKFAETSSPRAERVSASSSRHIPASIRRAVSERDAGRCTYVSASGRRCETNEFLEFDHAEAWTWTRTHSIDGITLRCRAHNQLRARQDFGEAHMARFGRRTGFESSSHGPHGAVPLAPPSAIQSKDLIRHVKQVRERTLQRRTIGS
jgi:hypothetical protein